MSELKQTKIHENEIAKSSDLQHISDASLTNLYRVIMGAFGPTKNCILAGGQVYQTTPPGMNINISPTIGVNISDSSLLFSDSVTGPVAVEAAGVADRIDIVQVRLKKEYYDLQQRAFKDPATKIVTYQEIETKYRIVLEADVKAGVPGNGSAPEVDSGWVKLAEIHVAAGQTAITNDMIVGCSAYQPDEMNAWTSEGWVTYTMKTIEGFKQSFRVGHREDGSHDERSVGATAIKFGLDDDEVRADTVPVATTPFYPDQTTVQSFLVALSEWVDTAGAIGPINDTYGLDQVLDIFADLIQQATGTNPPTLYAADTILIRQLVAKNQSGNQVVVADKRYGDNIEVIGFAVTGYTPGQSVLVKNRDYVSGFTGLLPGQPLFLSSAGGYTQDDNTIAIGEWRVPVGLAISDTTVWVDIKEPMRKIATTQTYLSGVGLEFAWPGTDAAIPEGYLKEDGRAVSRTTYADLNALAAAAGYTSPWGPGNGTSTFNIPTKAGSIIRYLPFIQTVNNITNEIGGVAEGTVGIHFANRQIEMDLSGYFTYVSAHAPVTEGGVNYERPTGQSLTPSAALTLAHNKATPLFGLGDAILTKPAQATLCHGVYYDFTIDAGAKGKQCELSFFYRTGGTYNNDIRVWIVDLSTGHLTLTNRIVVASASPKRHSSTFNLGVGTTYRLMFDVGTSSASGFTFEFDNIQINSETWNAAEVLDLLKTVDDPGCGLNADSVLALGIGGSKGIPVPGNDLNNATQHGCIYHAIPFGLVNGPTFSGDSDISVMVFKDSNGYLSQIAIAGIYNEIFIRTGGPAIGWWSDWQRFMVTTLNSDGHYNAYVTSAENADFLGGVPPDYYVQGQNSSRVILWSSYDLDSITKSGFYNGANMGHAPDNNWWFIQHYEHFNYANHYARQIAYPMGSATGYPNTGDIYTRMRDENVGTWSTWTKMVTESQIPLFQGGVYNEEGGEIRLAPPQSGSGVGYAPRCIDVWGNTLRMFTEVAGVGARGFQFDLSKAPVGPFLEPYHPGHQGAGTGMDADKLDGKHASAFAPIPVSTYSDVGSFWSFSGYPTWTGSSWLIWWGPGGGGTFVALTATAAGGASLNINPGGFVSASGSVTVTANVFVTLLLWRIA